MNRQLVAREWLWVVGCTVVAGAVLAAMIVGSPDFGTSHLPKAEALFVIGLFTIPYGLAVYIAVGVVRLTWWAVRHVKKPQLSEGE